MRTFLLYNDRTFENDRDKLIWRILSIMFRQNQTGSLYNYEIGCRSDSLERIKLILGYMEENGYILPRRRSFYMHDTSNNVTVMLQTEISHKGLEFKELMDSINNL